MIGLIGLECQNIEPNPNVSTSIHSINPYKHINIKWGIHYFYNPILKETRTQGSGFLGISLQPHRVVLYKDDQTNYVFFIYQISSNTVALTTKVIVFIILISLT